MQGLLSEQNGKFTYMKISFFVSLLLLVSIAFSQTSLSGIVNNYYGVSNIKNASATLTLSSTAGLAVGDVLLLIQMKGANINLSASGDYGNIDAYNGHKLFPKLCKILLYSVETAVFVSRSLKDIHTFYCIFTHGALVPSPTMF